MKGFIPNLKSITKQLKSQIVVDLHHTAMMKTAVASAFWVSITGPLSLYFPHVFHAYLTSLLLTELPGYFLHVIRSLWQGPWHYMVHQVISRGSTVEFFIPTPLDTGRVWIFLVSVF